MNQCCCFVSLSNGMSLLPSLFPLYADRILNEVILIRPTSYSLHSVATSSDGGIEVGERHGERETSITFVSISAAGNEVADHNFEIRIHDFSEGLAENEPLLTQTDDLNY